VQHKKETVMSPNPVVPPPLSAKFGWYANAVATTRVTSSQFPVIESGITGSIAREFAFRSKGPWLKVKSSPNGSLITSASGFLAIFLSSSGALCGNAAGGVKRRYAVHTRIIRMLESDGASVLELLINPLRIFSQAPKKQEDSSGLCDGQTTAYFFRLLSDLAAEGDGAKGISQLSTPRAIRD
jgi:hypothetical protein